MIIEEIEQIIPINLHFSPLWPRGGTQFHMNEDQFQQNCYAYRFKQAFDQKATKIERH